MRIFIFYSGFQEIEKDFEERNKLLEQLKNIDQRIEVRNGLMMGMLKGILETNSYKKDASSEIKLLTGGETMKFQGVTIHKNKTCDTWYARYRKNGKQIYISAKTQKDCYDKLKSEILKKQKEELKKLKQADKQEPKENSITLREWYEKWLKLYKQNVKKNTIYDYEKSLKYLDSIINKPLNKITAIEFIEILNGIKYERRKQCVYDLANALFEKAYQNEIITRNPIKIIDKPKHKKINGLAFSNEDESILEQYLLENNRFIFLICLYQGLRRGEVLGLTGDNIDFEKGTLTINKAYSTSDEFTTTKNEFSARTMPIFEKTKPILKQVYKTGRLFPITYSYCGKAFDRIKEKLFPDKRYSIHSFRHTFVTRCQEAGVPLHIIQKWVGHNEGSSITNRVYTHTREVAEAENIEKINNLS